jgi:hypothetical protein
MTNNYVRIIVHFIFSANFAKTYAIEHVSFFV